MTRRWIDGFPLPRLSFLRGQLKVARRKKLKKQNKKATLEPASGMSKVGALVFWQRFKHFRRSFFVVVVFVIFFSSLRSHFLPGVPDSPHGPSRPLTFPSSPLLQTLTTSTTPSGQRHSHVHQKVSQGHVLNKRSSCPQIAAADRCSPVVVTSP